MLGNEQAVIKKAKRYLELLGIYDFEIIEFLGRGAFGFVVKAKKANDPIGVYAIKIIKEDIYDPDYKPQEKKFLDKFYQRIKQNCNNCVVNIYPSYLREFFDETEGLYLLSIVADYIPYKEESN
jgi:serine/threonine protein kinase